MYINEWDQMRVIDHKQLQETRRKKAKSQRKTRFVICAVLITGLVLGLVYTKHGQAPSDSRAISSTIPADKPKKGILKVYTPEQFRDLYNNFAYPNTQEINESTPITGNQPLDERIRTLAAERGYILRSAPVTDTFVQVAPGMILQQRAAQPWADMQAAAKKDNVNITLSAAYRSSAEQLSIFLSRFSPRSATAVQVAAGSYDKQIIDTLSRTAPPGYSRHHTGYTIDIECDGNINLVFERTACFRWLSADNYKNAKTHGWIPSYPEGIQTQGPEPESWEYVWVGIDTLTE
jgi:LAS superfamily LD-carboxypeptidase LdcB